MRRLAAFVLLAFAVGCAPPEKSVADPLEEARRQVSAADSLRDKHPERMRIYADVGGRLVAVTDTANWPETEVSYNVWLDSSGRPLIHAEAPVSQSGDWGVVYTHYFDEQGRTRVFDSEAAWFNSLCTDVLRRHVRMYYDERFGLLRADTSYSDADKRPVDARKLQCQNPYEFNPTPRATYAELVRANKAPAADRSPE